MKGRELAFVICLFVGVTVGLSGYISTPIINSISSELLSWGVVLGAFALTLGLLNSIRIHGGRIARRHGTPGDRVFSAVLLGMMAIATVVGLAKGTTSDQYQFIYKTFLTPLDGTIFALIAFFIASAAWRAFIARNSDAAILLVTATIVMLGRAPIGELITRALPEATAWIMDIPNMAAQRGIIIGAALGSIALGLRILLGIERSYLGRG